MEFRKSFKYFVFVKSFFEEYFFICYCHMTSFLFNIVDNLLKIWYVGNLKNQVAYMQIIL